MHDKSCQARHQSRTTDRDDTMRDGEFIAEAQDRKLLLRPQAAEALRALITQAVVTPSPCSTARRTFWPITACPLHPMSGGKAHITAGFTHLKGNGEAKHAVREVCDHLPDNRFVLRTVVSPTTPPQIRNSRRSSMQNLAYIEGFYNRIRLHSASSGPTNSQLA
jgi:hypothetical protein